MGSCLNKTEESKTRTINIPYDLPSANRIQTTKYTFLTFLPKSILFQFLRAANYVYLLSAILNFLPIISASSPAVNLAPLIVILLLSVLREDIQKRYKNDKKINQSSTKVLEQDMFIDKLWQQVKIGDFVKVSNNEIIPADLILLYSTEENGIAYVQTANLDGQRNLKPKYCIQNTPSIYPEQYSSLKALIVIQSPNKNLHDFDGNISFNSGQSKFIRQQNMLLRGTILKNTHYIVGLTAYTGQQTKIMLNQGNFKNKVSIVSKKINVIQLCLGIVLLIMCTINGIMNYQVLQTDKTFYLVKASSISNQLQAAASAMSCFLLLNFIVPISLNISIEILKTFQADFYGMDDKMTCLINEQKQSCKVLNSLIIQQLGIVQYILTDKTGTLTSNTMQFKQIWVKQKQYTAEQLLKNKTNIPTNKQLDIFWKYLCLCHDVIIDSQQNQFQGSSADQVCFLQFGREINYKFLKRTKTHLQLQIRGNKIVYQLLMVLPFSQRKMMSVIVKDMHSQQIILITKGADSSMLKRKGNMTHQYQHSLNDFLMKISKHGLRTLVIGYKILTLRQYRNFKQQIQKYQNKKRNRQIQNNNDNSKQKQDLSQIYSLVEDNIQIIGCTGIQDKLQQGVPECIYNFRQAGIKIVMITGDKLQTAQNIGYLSNFININAQIFRFRQSLTNLQNQIIQTNKIIESLNNQDFSIIIEGTIIIQIISISDQNTNLILKNIVQKCKSIIFCRSTPSQKALIVDYFKKTFSSTVLAIGDGGNDVNMIKQADIGIGLIGKQGNEAAYASDFYFGQFKHIERLLFHHGRWSYNRISYFFVYFGFKNNLITLLLFLYLFYSGYSGRYGLSELYQGCYNSFLGIIPTMYIGIFEQDVNGDQNSSIKKKLPQLYKSCRSSDLFSYKRYLIWTILSVMCAVWLFFPTYYIMSPLQSNNSRGNPADWRSFSTNLQVTSCIVIMCILAIDVQMYNWWTVFCIGGGAYLASFIAFIIQNFAYISGFDDCYLAFSDNFNLRFWCLVLVLTSGVLLPKITYKAIEYQLFPDEVQKMRKIQKYQVSDNQSQSAVQLRGYNQNQ